MIEAIVAHYTDAEERAEVASAIRHEIARRIRRSIMTSETLKVCPTCDTAKEHAAYRRHAGRADGLQWQCRACQVR
jgi:formylmethanofuran:tetrahydromethanopterin formyltransferase